MLPSRTARYLSCLRPGEILVLQGTPLLGAAFGLAPIRTDHVGLLVILLLANITLIAHVFVLNDWSNLGIDAVDPNKSGAVFTKRGVTRSGMARLAVALLLVSLGLFGLLALQTFVLALAIAGLSALYSLPRFNWKARPLLSSVAHLAGGIVHFLLGYSIAGRVDRRGILVATFFALTFAAGHLCQELRDHGGDARSRVRTNAVVFGPRRTFVASLVLFGLAHAVLGALAASGLIPRALGLLVLLYPLQLVWSFRTLSTGLTYNSVSQLQKRYRVLYGTIGVVIVATLWLG